MTNRHFLSCNIAGFTYWDGLEVFEFLKVGTTLQLEAEPDNKFDSEAVKILFNKTMIGYIPGSENKLISQLLQLGYTDMFSAKISRISSDEHPEKQIYITIKINPAHK